MKAKKSFVLYTSWRSLFELLEEPELIKELLYAVFDLAEGKEVVITNSKVRTAFNAIEPVMREDLEAYKVRCEKNKAAAQKRWNPSDMHLHTDGLQSDGDNVYDYDYDCDYENDNDSDNDSDISPVKTSQGAPSVADVIEASHNRGVDMPKSEAEAFISYYYVDLKGLINGEPIRNWRNLLNSWGDHILVDTDALLGEGIKGYDAYLTLPTEVQKLIDSDQERFGGRKITKATADAIARFRKAV